MSSKDASKEAGSPSKVKTDADSNNAPKSTLELLEEDDEFEEFDQGNWDSNSAQQEEDKQLWKDDWDDDEPDDTFTEQLRSQIRGGNAK